MAQRTSFNLEVLVGSSDLFWAQRHETGNRQPDHLHSLKPPPHFRQRRKWVSIWELAMEKDWARTFECPFAFICFQFVFSKMNQNCLFVLYVFFFFFSKVVCGMLLGLGGVCWKHCCLDSHLFSLYITSFCWKIPVAAKQTCIS